MTTPNTSGATPLTTEVALLPNDPSAPEVALLSPPEVALLPSGVTPGKARKGGGFSHATLPKFYHRLLSQRTPDRDWHCLTLVAGGCGYGLSVRQQLAHAAGMQPNSRSIWLVFTRLQKVGLLHCHTLTTVLGSGRIREHLQMLILTPLGREVCTAAGLVCRETDYERLCRLHRGTEFPDHTLALLLFKREAEARGHMVEFCPEAGPDHPAIPPGYIPDTYVRTWQGDDWYGDYVEVERGEPEPAKWAINARLNDGCVFVCAPNPQKRATYTAQLRAQKQAYFATDLRSLLKDRYSPLWLERDS